MRMKVNRQDGVVSSQIYKHVCFEQDIINSRRGAEMNRFKGNCVILTELYSRIETFAVGIILN